jgi:hypothetical protein
MHFSARAAAGLAALALTATTAHLAGSAAPATTAKAAGGFELTVDSIMRGPKLVGYPPAGLRWAGDSSRLYFEWRRPGDDEPSTWVVTREGGAPRKLTDEERRTAPRRPGRRTGASPSTATYRRLVAGTRRQITHHRQRGNPRWARSVNLPHLTRDNNSVLVPLDSGELTQLTDVQPKTRSARDRQPVRQGRGAEAPDHTRIEAEKKRRPRAGRTRCRSSSSPNARRQRSQIPD